MLRRSLVVALSVVLAPVLLSACPPCPKGYHQVTTPFPGSTFHIEAHDVARETRVDVPLAVKAGYTYVFSATGSGLLRDDGPDGKPRSRSFTPNGIEGELAPAGSPVAGFNNGSLLVYFGTTPYWIGEKGLPLKAPADGSVSFALNVQPGTPAPGTGIANPNTIDLNFQVSVEVSYSACVKDDEPPAKKFSELFQVYFAGGTAGDCVNAGCHGKSGNSAPFFGGTDSDHMYDWLAGKSKLTTLGDPASSRLRWCSTTSGGHMPANSNAAPMNVCTELQAWASHGAPR